MNYALNIVKVVASAVKSDHNVGLVIAYSGTSHSNINKRRLSFSIEHASQERIDFCLTDDVQVNSDQMCRRAHTIRYGKLTCSQKLTRWPS